MICNICPRKCNVDRDLKQGYCNSPSAFRLARASLHFWEEPCISGKNGSGAVFFSGCNLRCVYCQNYEISRENKGVEVCDEKLVEIFERLISHGAENINLVNPTHYAKRLSDLFESWESPVPIVYNTGAYESVNTLKVLNGKVDIYLPDLKYIRSDKAKRYSSAENYFEIASNALKEMRLQVKDSFDENGMMKSGMIVRHLILPQNTNSSLALIDWLCENLPDTYLSLMAQYVPCGDLSSCPEIYRKITEREYNKVVDYALSKGMEKIFIQEMSSADKKFIPPFDFSGIM
ncbi:MAG: 4Fe-4S cluster-binding domain-containing protein [Eubacterium sp.]|nr:4Fe-4S cluster-binding domain-containing protein [Eubacterium sp.]